MTNEVIAVTNQALAKWLELPDSGFGAPLHNWTIEIANRSYGIAQWHEPGSVIYFGTHWWTLPFSAPVTAALLLLIITLLLFGAFYLIAHRTRKSDPDDA